MKQYSSNNLAYTLQIIAIILIFAFQGPLPKTGSKAVKEIETPISLKKSAFSKPFVVFGIYTSWEYPGQHKFYTLINRPFLASK